MAGGIAKPKARPRRFLKWALGGAAVALLGVTAAALATQYTYQESAWRTWSRALRPELEWQRAKYPSVDWAFGIAAAFLTEDDRASFREVATDEKVPLVLSPDVGPQDVTGSVPVRYDASGVPLSSKSPVASGSGSIAVTPSTPTVVVGDDQQLRQAIKKATAGAHILMLPGTYRISRGNIEVMAQGRPEAPIFLRASRLGDVTIQFAVQQGFIVRGAYWVFENLVIEGACRSDEGCEHAFHVVGNAKGTVIRNNVVRNFNAPVKVNLVKDRTRTPDAGLIENNRFNNDWPRKVTKPVTLIDIVGANSWTVAGNIIADFAKNGSDYVSYGAFFKGASFGGVFERNLIMCEWRHRGGARVGLSLGGGGTADFACRDRQCAFESDGAVIRNNIVLNCPNDVGLYLNKASNAVVHNNLIANTVGIDARYPETDALIFNNIIDGRVRERDGGTATLENNLTAGLAAALRTRVSADVFRNPGRGDFTVKDADPIKGEGRPLPVALRDFCGRPHKTDAPDIGPFSLDAAQPCRQTWVRP